MRVNITVYVSEGGYTYTREGQVNREATFEAEIEGLKSIPWGGGPGRAGRVWVSRVRGQAGAETGPGDAGRPGAEFTHDEG